jgi:hypothetical protein
MIHLKLRLPYHLFFVMLCITISIACNKDGNAKALDGCCDTPAINAVVGNGHVYVPNVFTPNGDGINDRLVVYGDQNIILIRSFRVSDKEGTSVFYAEDIVPNDPTHVWDGTVNAKYKNGVYYIVMVVQAFEDTIVTLEGKVCNYRCLDSGEEDPISGAGCQFPTQVIDGVYNSTIPTGENAGCFE